MASGKVARRTVVSDVSVLLDSPEIKALIAVPLEPGSDPAVLQADTNISNADAERSVPIQSWGRRADG